MKDLTLKTTEATFLALQKSSQELAERCDHLTIVDDISLQIATQNYSMLKDSIKQIEEIRVKEKAPYLDAGKQIDALAKKLSSPLDQSLESGRAKVMAYNKIKREEAEKIQRRINMIKEAIQKYSSDAIKSFNSATTIEDLTEARSEWVLNFPGEEVWFEFMADAELMKSNLNDYCKARRIEIVSPAQADQYLSDSINEVIEENVAEVGVVEIAQAQFQTTTKFRGTPKFRIVDESAIPREFMVVDESKIRAYQKEYKDILSDGEIRFGIEFYIEQTVIIK